MGAQPVAVASETPPSIPVLSPCDAMKQEVAKYPDWDYDTMQAIAQAENRACNPLNHNLTASETHRDINGNVVCVGSYNVLQVGCINYQAGENRDDMATNIKVAHRVWQSQGYRAWTMYKNGTYRQFL